MKKIAQINIVDTGSTGKIMNYIKDYVTKNDFSCKCYYGRGKKSDNLTSIKFALPFSFLIHGILATMFGWQGHFSYFSTKRLVRMLKDYDPDIIHLHNIHGYYLNYHVLFDYLKNEFTGKVVWTFHDCYPFTGHCAHFTYVKCNKWISGCYNCPQKNSYPISLFFDNSRKEYLQKKDAFLLKNLSVVTVSDWMRDNINKSFFNNYDVTVINNFVDFNVFHYTIDKNIYHKYNINNSKKIYLGVASEWKSKKGLDSFVKMSYKLKDDEQIVLVGLNSSQLKKLPKNIIGIKKTENVKELVKLYSIATVFVNPSVEESFSLVTLEAMACKTPVVVLDTSAVKELVCFADTGVVTNNNCDDILREARSINYRISDCTRKLIEKKYNSNVICNKYYQLYKNLLKNDNVLK